MNTDVAVKVLVAEDEPLIRLDLVEMLTEEGYQVTPASNGLEAVALAQQISPDLIIMDVKMPKLDGLSAAEQLQELRIAPIVMLTAFSQQDFVARAAAAGAMGYLVKPFTKSDLLPAIEVARSRFSEITELIAQNESYSEQLATRKAVDRAKGILQEKLGLTEPESFRWVQKTAMDLRLSMREVAEGVIKHGPK